MFQNQAGPVVTDNGMWIVDCDFGPIENPRKLDMSIREIVGVVESGLFCNMAEAAFFGQEDGSVVEVHRKTHHKI